MREIKFRAWDTKDGKYYAPLHEAYSGRLYELMISMSGFILAHTMRGIEGGEGISNKYILEQYTGLHDKNGREIYEGDIIIIPDIIPVVVSFDRGSFIQNTVGPYCSLLDFISEHSAFGAPEVAGNIHDNKDLLS